VYRFMSKHSSDHYVVFNLDPLSHLAINPSSCMKLIQGRILRGTGNGERGTGNGERGTGNGESLKLGIFKMGNL